jgi:hypothetical protein
MFSTASVEKLHEQARLRDPLEKAIRVSSENVIKRDISQGVSLFLYRSLSFAVSAGDINESYPR